MIKLNIMIRKIKSYRYAWNLTTNTGFIQFELEGLGWRKPIRYDNAVEFHIVISTLQNETPVFLGKSRNNQFFIQTTPDEVGEDFGTARELFEK